jgi:hypothetical protein
MGSDGGGGKRAVIASDMGTVTLVTTVGMFEFMSSTLKTYGRHSVPWCVAAQPMCRDILLCVGVLSCISPCSRQHSADA